MPKSSTFENDFLKLILLNQAIAGIGDAPGLQPSAMAGSLYVTMHTADPSAGNQLTSEVSYTGYGGRVAVPRSGAGFTVVGNVGQFTGDILLAPCTGGALQTATHVGVGTSPSGAGKLLFAGPLTPNVAIQNGVTPVVGAGTTFTET